MPSTVTGVYDSLLQGISQQPNRDRQPGQCKDSFNLVPSPIDGLHDRPPTEYINQFTTTSNADTKWHNYKSGEDEEYIIAVQEGTVEVTDFQGTPISVAIEAASLTYFSQGTLPMSERLQLVTLGDTTLIANREVETSILQPVFPEWNSSLVYFRSITPGRTISITVEAAALPSVTFTHTVPTTVSVTPVVSDDIARQTDIQNQIKAGGTDVVAKVFYDAMIAHGTFTDDYNVSVQGSVIWIDTALGGGPDVFISVTDDMGGITVYAINRELQDSATLPPNAPHGYVARITGDGSNVKDDYYLEYRDPNEAAFNSNKGRWKEVTRPRQNFRLNPDDMPQALIRLSNGTFRVSPLDPLLEASNAGIQWKDREAGDNITNEFPHFTGHKIQDMGLFQDRLYFIAGESITLSESQDYFNFFKQSTVTSVASDPINRASNNNQVSILRYAVQQNRDLVIFARDCQFVIRGNQPLTPLNTAMTVSTNFASDLRVDPVSAGDVIFFPFKTGSFSGVREFFSNAQGTSNNARPITSHVDKLINGSIIEMVANSQEDILIIRGETAPNELIIYNYLWQNGERVQAAWGRWLLDERLNVEYMFFDESDLIVMLKDPADETIHGVILRLEDNAVSGLTHNVYLDNRLTGTSINTSFVVPASYPYDATATYEVIQGEGCPYPGLHVPFTYDAGTVTLGLDMTGGTVYFGTKYTRTYEPSLPVVRDSQGRILDPHRFTLNKFMMQYTNSGKFKVKLSHKAYGDFEYEVTSNIVGQLVLGQVDLSSGTHDAIARLPVDTDLNVSYTSDSYLPFALSALEWEGQFTTRGRRI